MATIRVKNIGNQILIVQDNKTADFYDKDKLIWSASNGVIILRDKTSESETTLLSAQPSDFKTPTNSEISVVDLLIILNNMLLVSGSMPEKIVVGDYTLTNDDANYLILWDLSGGSATMKLPPDAQAGLTWKVKDIGNAAVGTNEGTVSGNGRNVEGVATAPVIDTPYEARWLYLSESLGEYLFE